MPRYLPVLLMPLLLCLGSCASGLKAPRMSLVSLGVDEVNLSGVGLDIGFTVRNPNPVPLEIERFEYRLELNGQRLGTGYYAEPLSIPAFEEQRVKARFNLGFFSLPAPIKALLEQAEVRAGLKASFYVLDQGRSRTLSYESESTVPITK